MFNKLTLNNNMKKIITIPIIFFSIFNYSFSQPQPISSNQIEKNQLQVKSSLSPEKKYLLEELLANSSYQDFFEQIKKLNIKDDEYISFLLSKRDQGHIPLYWLISDFYASKNNAQETHKWLYISLIMTQQDSYLCSDLTARNAPRILLNSFPRTSELTRKTPQHIESSMREVIFFITNLKNRIDPTWVCNYGEDGVNPGNSILIPKSNWNSKREEILKRFVDKYNR